MKLTYLKYDTRVQQIPVEPAFAVKPASTDLERGLPACADDLEADGCRVQETTPDKLGRQTGAGERPRHDRILQHL
jgi:hypothetical protein